MTKFDPNECLEVFLLGNVLRIINFMGKSLEFFIYNKIVKVSEFLIKNMPKNLGFYDRKMN